MLEGPHNTPQVDLDKKGTVEQHSALIDVCKPECSSPIHYIAVLTWRLSSTMQNLGQKIKPALLCYNNNMQMSAYTS